MACSLLVRQPRSDWHRDRLGPDRAGDPASVTVTVTVTLAAVAGRGTECRIAARYSLGVRIIEVCLQRAASHESRSRPRPGPRDGNTPRNDSEPRGRCPALAVGRQVATPTVTARASAGLGLRLAGDS